VQNFVPLKDSKTLATPFQARASDGRAPHGTHQGTFLGIAPTGRKIHFETVDAMRVHEGKIIEHWGVANLYSPMQRRDIGSTSQLRKQRTFAKGLANWLDRPFAALEVGPVNGRGAAGSGLTRVAAERRESASLEAICGTVCDKNCCFCFTQSDDR
jgi:hypothetical protein